jgi:hypothetical protein
VFVAGRGRKLLAAALAFTLASCSSEPASPPKVDAAAVYETVIRWFARSDRTDPDPLPVFVEPRGQGTSIALDVQADVVKVTTDVATVRFIDTRDEALTTNDDGEVVVADGGMLIRLAPVVEQGTTMQLDVDVYQQDQEFHTLQFDLGISGDRWTITQPPTTAPNG